MKEKINKYRLSGACLQHWTVTQIEKEDDVETKERLFFSDQCVECVFGAGSHNTAHPTRRYMCCKLLYE